MSIESTLAERGARYGSFKDHARICQGIKLAMQAADGWDELPDVHRQALEVIADKIARVLNGDPLYLDNFRDIAGYATLVLKHTEIEGATDSVNTPIVFRNGAWVTP